MIEIRTSGQSIRAPVRGLVRIALSCAFVLALLWLAWGDAQPVSAEPPWPEPPVGTRTQLPVLSFVGQEGTNQTLIQVQNVGSEFTRAIILIWGEAGACGPQAVGPFKVECSGIIKPGATWMFGPQQTPPGAKSGIVYTFPQEQVVIDGVPVAVADEFCERLFSDVTFDADAYRRFDLAFRQGDDFFGLPTTGGQPVAVDVVRVAQGSPSRDLTVSGAYAGLTGPEEGAFDPVFGGFAYYVPIVYADAAGLTSWVYIQNSGLDCTGAELWFQEQGDCLRAQICEVITLAPGETAQYNVSDCVGPSFVGNLWIRTSQPSGVVVDHIGQDVLMTDKGVAARNAIFDAGDEVLFGPLIYREFQGWESAVTVQNLSGTQQGMVKVYFYDQSGNIITTLVDWICPRGTQTFFLPVINGLPGQYVGAIRVESQTSFRNAGSDGPFVPIAGVAHLRKYTDPTTSHIQEAISYNLFGEPQSFDWQLGPGNAGLIGVPSVLKQGRGLSTELAIQNVNPNPGFTDFAIYLYDANGLLEVVCEKLNAYNVEYINFNSWGIINPGFVGSVVISGVFTNQEGGIGLSAVAIERVQSILQFNTPGDESSGFEAFPIFTENFDFEGPHPPQCPGLPPPDTCEMTVAIQVTDNGMLPPFGQPIQGAVVQLRSLTTEANQPLATGNTDENGLVHLRVRVPNTPFRYGIWVQETPDDQLTLVGRTRLLIGNDPICEAQQGISIPIVVGGQPEFFDISGVATTECGAGEPVENVRIQLTQPSLSASDLEDLLEAAGADGGDALELCLALPDVCDSLIEQQLPPQVFAETRTGPDGAFRFEKVLASSDADQTLETLDAIIQVLEAQGDAEVAAALEQLLASPETQSEVLALVDGYQLRAILPATEGIQDPSLVDFPSDPFLLLDDVRRDFQTDGIPFVGVSEVWCPTAETPSTPSPPPNELELNGKVTECGSTPVQGATVAILTNGTPVVTAMTDTKGDFTLESIHFDGGTYHIKVDLDSDGTFDEQWVAPDGSTEIELIHTNNDNIIDGSDLLNTHGARQVNFTGLLCTDCDEVDFDENAEIQLLVNGELPGGPDGAIDELAGGNIVIRDEDGIIVATGAINTDGASDLIFDQPIGSNQDLVVNYQAFLADGTPIACSVGIFVPCAPDENAGAEPRELYAVINHAVEASDGLAAGECEIITAEVGEVGEVIPTTDATIVGRVVDNQTGQPIIGATATAVNTSNGEAFVTKTNSFGWYVVGVNGGATHVITVGKDGFEPESETFLVPANDVVIQDFRLIPLVE